MHRNNSSIAMHRDRIASWHVNRDTNRIVTSLAIPTPNMNAQWSYYDHNELGSTGIRFDENQHVFWYILVLYLDKHAASSRLFIQLKPVYIYIDICQFIWIENS